MSKTAIYIPSMGRAGKLFTIYHIPPAWRKNTFIVVPKAEQLEYSLIYGVPFNDKWRYGDAFNIIAPPDSVQRIGPTRDWIVKHAAKAGYTNFIMMDDDLTFAKRREDDSTKFLPASVKDTAAMLKALETLLKTSAHVGVLGREGANRITKPVVYATRMMRVIGYQVAALQSRKLKFADGIVMDDFYMTLSLLVAGLPNAVLCSYVQNQSGSNAKGGAAMYRNAAMHAAAAENLRSKFPEFVKVVAKKATWGWESRVDVVVAWKKALESSKQLSLFKVKK